MTEKTGTQQLFSENIVLQNNMCHWLSLFLPQYTLSHLSYLGSVPTNIP